MTREEIARATYDVAERLNAVKRRHGLIDAATADGVTSRLRVARGLLDSSASTVPPNHAAVEMANHGTMFGDDELKWPVGHRFRIGPTLLRSLAAGLGQEIATPPRGWWAATIRRPLDHRGSGFGTRGTRADLKVRMATRSEPRVPSPESFHFFFNVAM